MILWSVGRWESEGLGEVNAWVGHVRFGRFLHVKSTLHFGFCFLRNTRPNVKLTLHSLFRHLCILKPQAKP